MLKINASYSKKVPAETEYSSQSYHCTIESELPDGLAHQQLQERIHATFAMVKQAVEAELHGGQQPVSNPVSTPAAPQVPQQQPIVDQQAVNTANLPLQDDQREPQNSYRNKQHTRAYQPASGKQINYLLNLAKRIGWSAQDIINHCQVNRLEEIDKRICSQLIEQFSGRAA